MSLTIMRRVEDAEQALSRGSIQTARAIYAHATATFPSKKNLWIQMANLEKKYGTPESTEEVLAKSVGFCIGSDTLWLMYAKHKWVSGDVNGAREVLKRAFDANPDKESVRAILHFWGMIRTDDSFIKIWLAAVKLEKENGKYDLARIVLERARTTAGTARVWMKSALLERELGNTNEVPPQFLVSSDVLLMYCIVGGEASATGY